MTSNIDGHWERTKGIPPNRLFECHGSVSYMQNLNGLGGIWDTDPDEMGKMKMPNWDLVPGEAVEVIKRGISYFLPYKLI